MMSDRTSELEDLIPVTDVLRCYSDELLSSALDIGHCGTEVAIERFSSLTLFSAGRYQTLLRQMAKVRT